MTEDNANKEEMYSNGALKDSGTGVKFEDSGWRAAHSYRDPATPKIIQWTMKLSGGLVKDEKVASYVLLGFAVAAIAISLYLFFAGSSGTSSPKRIIDFPELQRQNAK